MRYSRLKIWPGKTALWRGLAWSARRIITFVKFCLLEGGSCQSPVVNTIYISDEKYSFHFTTFWYANYWYCLNCALQIVSCVKVLDFFSFIIAHHHNWLSFLLIHHLVLALFFAVGRAYFAEMIGTEVPTNFRFRIFPLSVSAWCQSWCINNMHLYQWIVSVVSHLSVMHWNVACLLFFLHNMDILHHLSSLLLIEVLSN